MIVYGQEGFYSLISGSRFKIPPDPTFEFPLSLYIYHAKVIVGHVFITKNLTFLGIFPSREIKNV